ncbi:tyrosine-type recombinase/integrase [Hyphococcus sp. DH-69]|uniref:tyrosine-type recombinase/integrase n=1 Tax=Hyphococcus formosus TaxID=3143534 RepID=UPI00398AF4DC
MPRTVYNQLTARRVASLEKPGRYTDGLGLMLHVVSPTSRRWVMRVTAAGRRMDIGLGSAREVSLREARDRRDEIRAQIRNGQHPLPRHRRNSATPTFSDYALRLHAALKHEWKNEKHAAQWISTLKRYAFPKLGHKALDQITALDVKEALEPVWTAKPETARRVKQRISKVLSAAIGEGLRDAPNPAIDATTALGSKRPKQRHFASMAYGDVPQFLGRIATSQMDPAAKLAFAFLVLNASRTSEVLLAEWSEIDLDGKLWTIPAERMKMGEMHQVPLSSRSVAILEEAKELFGDGSLIFPGRRRGMPLSNMVFLTALKRMDEPYTAHGFRSSFRDWAEERTSYPHTVKEAALAHKTRDKVEAAYRRTTLVEQRRAMMQDWCAFLEAHENRELLNK